MSEKFLYIADIHLRLEGFSSRADDFIETAFKKLEFVANYAKRNNINIILFGGDLFNAPRVGYELLNKTMSYFYKYKDINFLMIPGNHDLYGWAPHTIKNTAMFSITRMKNVHLLKNETLLNVPNKSNLPIGIYSQWADYDNEGSSKSLALKKFGKNVLLEKKTFIIQMTHTMIVQKSFFGKFIPFEDIPIKKVGHLLLCSHYHPGFAVTNLSHNTYIANPGSLMRIAKTKDNMSKIPQMLLIELIGDEEVDATNLEYIPINIAKPNPFKEKAEVVEEAEEIEYDIQHADVMKRLLNAQAGVKSVDPQKLTKAIAEKEGISGEVLRKAIQALQTAGYEREVNE